MWIDTIEPIISTRIDVMLKEKYSTKFPELNTTTVDIQPKDPAFPSVYVHMLPILETGEDLEALTINAINCTMQVEVNTNTSQQDAKQIMSTVIKIMKKMRFRVQSGPQSQNMETYRQVARFARIIGSGDVL